MQSYMVAIILGIEEDYAIRSSRVSGWFHNFDWEKDWEVDGFMADVQGISRICQCSHY